MQPENTTLCLVALAMIERADSVGDMAHLLPGDYDEAVKLLRASTWCANTFAVQLAEQLDAAPADIIAMLRDTLLTPDTETD